MSVLAKTYYNYIEDISDDEAYEGFLGHGLFSEKIPPFFSSHDFFQYCLNNNFSNKQISQYIHYENIRNINLPRVIGIPNPFSYNNLCKSIKENWTYIQKHFKDMTLNNSHKVSRIHIRKIKNTKSLFEMNYKKYPYDAMPEPGILLGKKYKVCVDISNCFPSIYTHALSWALVGKEKAKKIKKIKNYGITKLIFILEIVRMVKHTDC